MSTLGFHDDDRSGVAPAVGPLDPAEVVRRFYRSFELRDMSRLASLLAGDVAWRHGPGAVPASLGVAAPEDPNRDALVSFLVDLVDRSGGTCRWRLQQLLRHDDGAIVAAHETTSASAPMSTGHLLFTVDADLIRRVVVLSPVPTEPSGP